MKRMMSAVMLLLLSGLAFSEGPLPLRNPVLQTDMDAGGFKITNASRFLDTNNWVAVMVDVDGFVRFPMNFVEINELMTMGAFAGWTNAHANSDPVTNYVPRVGAVSIIGLNSSHASITGLLIQARGYYGAASPVNLVLSGSPDGSNPTNSAVEVVSNFSVSRGKISRFGHIEPPARSGAGGHENLTIKGAYAASGGQLGGGIHIVPGGFNSGLGAYGPGTNRYYLGTNIYIRSGGETDTNSIIVHHGDSVAHVELMWGGDFSYAKTRIVTNVDPTTISPPYYWRGAELQDVGSTLRLFRAFGPDTNSWVQTF